MISKGERNILSFLKDNNIKHEVQKKFEDCVNKKQLSFDFYIEQENLLIEFDGIQHFKPFGYIGGDEKLKYTIKCDKIKDEYCFDKKIRLLRIKYNELDKIENILSNYLKIII